jgi:hypothetical protein
MFEYMSAVMVITNNIFVECTLSAYSPMFIVNSIRTIDSIETGHRLTLGTLYVGLIGVWLLFQRKGRWG